MNQNCLLSLTWMIKINKSLWVRPAKDSTNLERLSLINLKWYNIKIIKLRFKLNYWSFWMLNIYKGLKMP